MDVSSLISGLRTLTENDIPELANHKMNSLRAAYENRIDLPSLSFEDFVSNTSLALVGTYFGNDSLDRFYTELIGGLTVGNDDFDVVWVVIVNFILMQLTYQGRYLARAWPEAFVLASGNFNSAVLASANAERVYNCSLGDQREVNPALTARLKKYAINFGEFHFSTSEQLTATIPQPPGRSIGCLAFDELSLDTFDPENLNKILSDAWPVMTEDSYLVFSGDPIIIQHVSSCLREDSPSSAFHQIYYNEALDGATSPKSLLVVTQVSACPKINAASELFFERFVVVPEPTVWAEGVASLEVVTFHPTESVNLKTPKYVSSSSPLPVGQVETITNGIYINYVAGKLNNGRILESGTANNRGTFVVITENNEIPAPFLDQGEFGASIYATPGVPIRKKKRLYVSGACYMLSFSPTILQFHSHFLLQCFPRIMIARELGPPEFKLMVASTVKSYQLEMLRMAGIRDEQIVIMHANYEYVCETLYTPTIMPAIFTPFYARIYDELILKSPRPTKKPYRRILISRAARTTWRNMLNYGSVCDLLIRDLGFELVEPDKLSLEDEITLFQESEIVVGAEGAGLYNCCFMAPGTDVVSLTDQDYSMYVLGAMGTIRGFDVSYVFGESFQADRDLTRKAGHADFIVDPYRVKACVQSIIEQKLAREPQA
jgi:hypothetical protein